MCGKREIDRGGHRTESAQRLYFDFATWIQKAESRIGSVTANEGKVYALRRSLFRPIAPSVTDDLYVLLSIVNQGYRFVFAPQIRARVPLPSRSLAHEVRRRRRIVGTSLRGIRLHARLLNPLHSGFFAYALLVNKVLRRMLSVWLLCLLAGNLVLAGRHLIWALILAIQALFYGSAILYAAAGTREWSLSLLLRRKPIGKLLEMNAYFFAGNLGTLLGLWDYALGRRVDKWEPEKSHLGGTGSRVAGKKGE